MHKSTLMTGAALLGILGVFGAAPAHAQGGPGGPPPGEPPPGGRGPGGPRSTACTLDGVYTLDHGAATLDRRTITSARKDISGVLVKNTGVLTMNNVTVSTSGNTSSEENSSFFGLNAGVLAAKGGRITMTGGSVTTSGSGANGVFATGAKSEVILANVTVKATGPAGHGVEASAGGTLTLTNVTIHTTDRNGAAIATDRGGGTITVSGGSAVADGIDSPGIYSTGAVTVTGATVRGTGAEAAVIEGDNSITLKTCTASGARKCGVMIYQSFSGDAEGRTGRFTMEGGSLTAAAGPLFYVTNATGVILLKGVKAEAASGTLVEAAAGRWGRAGSNGGHARLTADAQTLTGDLVCDGASSITVTLKNQSVLTGKIQGASVSLDASSRWDVTADSTVAGLTDAAGLAGPTIANIHGNGHTVHYTASLPANRWLGGRTYALSGGGRLLPGKEK